MDLILRGFEKRNPTDFKDCSEARYSLNYEALYVNELIQ